MALREILYFWLMKNIFTKLHDISTMGRHFYACHVVWYSVNSTLGGYLIASLAQQWIPKSSSLPIILGIVNNNIMFRSLVLCRLLILRAGHTQSKIFRIIFVCLIILLYSIEYTQHFCTFLIYTLIKQEIWPFWR